MFYSIYADFKSNAALLDGAHLLYQHRQHQLLNLNRRHGGVLNGFAQSDVLDSTRKFVIIHEIVTLL